MEFTRLWENVNDQQRTAVVNDSFGVCISAGPGSGKTQVLALRTIRLQSLTDVKAKEVLLLSFTNKASREMAERIERLTNGAVSSMWLTLGTFHSVCSRWLRRHGYLF